jgi:hypothetical protein
MELVSNFQNEVILLALLEDEATPAVSIPGLYVPPGTGPRFDPAGTPSFRPASEIAVVLELREPLAELGLEVEGFGGGTLVLNSYPVLKWTKPEM